MKCLHSVSLCMIAKNEASCIKRCLDSVSGIVNEVIVVDTGSTDNTVEIAKSCGAIVKYFKWNHSFSDARNYALSFATKEWILVLDADEYLRQEDREKLIEALNDTAVDGYIIKTLNYTGDIGSQSYIVNLNQRIFKNNQNYHYVGDIHEQVACIDKEKQTSAFKIIDVGFYHTGYLVSIVKEKNKTKRNSEILEKILEKDPDNPFHLFNLANEYSQMGEGKKALELYDRAYYHSNFAQGFVPKLIIFRITCMITLGKVNEALMAIEEGLKVYPDYTDLVYYRGTLERDAGKLTKAIRSFKKCLEMGKPRVELEYQTLCYDFGPALALAEIYDDFEDFEQAIHYYNQCLSLQPSRYQIVYKLMKCFKGVLRDRNTVIQTLSRYFNLVETSNRIIFIDALIQGEFYEEANRYLESSEEAMTNLQLLFLYGKNELYRGHYEKALDLFKRYESLNTRNDVEQYLCLIYLVNPNLLENETFTASYTHLLNYLKKDINLIEDSTLHEKLLFLLKEAYLMKDQILFNEIREKIDQIPAMDYHLLLANLYHENHQNQLAKKEILSYITKTNDCPPVVARLLCKLC